MKKIFLTLIIMVLFITGCGTKPEEELKHFFTNDIECEDMKMTMSLDFGIDAEGMSIDMNVPMSISYSNEVGKIELGKNPFIGEMELYIDKDNVYMPSKLIDLMIGIESANEYYIVQPIEETDEQNETSFNYTLTKEEMNGFVDSFGEGNIKFISTDGDIKQYRLTVTKSVFDYIYSLEGYTDMKNSLDELEINLDDFKFSFDIYINTKTNTYAKLQMNLIDIVNELMELSGEEIDDETKESLKMFKKMDIIIEIEGCNGINVTIPDEIKNNAITAEKYGEMVADSYYGDEENYYETDLNYNDNYFEEL